MIDKTPGSLAAEIVMTRQNWPGSFLVVEGPFDYRFFLAKTNENCQLVIGLGRRNIIEALKILEKNSLDKEICCLIDDDFDSLPNSNPHISNNLIRTDPRDLEGILLRSCALEKAIGEFCDQKLVKEFLRLEPPSIRNALLRRAEIFGKIHYINKNNNKVCLKPLKPKRFIDSTSWIYDESAVKIEAVRLGVATDLALLDNWLQSLPELPPWLLCRGHDLVDILYGGILKVFGGRQVSIENLEAVLRTGMESSELELTKMMNDMKKWEKFNHPSKILI